MELTKVENNLVFLFATFCSMNALMINGVSISNFILIILLTYHLFKYKSCLFINVESNPSKFTWLMLLSIILSIFTALPLLPISWLSNSLISLIKFILAYGYFFIFQSDKRIEKIRTVFLKGFYIGAVIQLLWGFVQEILYLSVGFKLNTFIFGNMLGQNSYIWDSYVAGNILRMKGLGWETANFALVLVIGYIISCYQQRNIIIRFLFILAIFFSTSRSGYIALLAVFIFQSFRIIRKKDATIKLQKLLLMVITVSILSCIILIFKSKLFLRWQLILQSFYDVSQNVDINSSSNIHLGYYTTLMQALRKIPLINLIVGTGYFSSGYFYDQNALTLNLSPLILTNPLGWNPESDFVTLMIGNGIFGTIVYYFWSIKGIIYQRNNYYSLLIIAVVVSGLTYLTIRGTWSGLIVAFALYKVTDQKKYQIGEKYE